MSVHSAPPVFWHLNILPDHGYDEAFLPTLKTPGCSGSDSKYHLELNTLLAESHQLLMACSKGAAMKSLSDRPGRLIIPIHLVRTTPVMLPICIAGQPKGRLEKQSAGEPIGLA